MSNRFAVLGSDSEDEGKTAEPTKTSQKQTKGKPQQNKAKQVAKAQDTQPDTRGRGRGERGRGRGDRGRGQRARGDATQGDYRQPRPYKGDYQFAEGEARGRGEGRGRRGGRGFRNDRGRGDRGHRGERGRGRGRYHHADGVYSHMAPRETVVKDENPENLAGDSYHEEQHYEHHGGYDRRTGTGYGREVKKGGAGKGGWGAPNYEKDLEHRDADVAADVAEEGFKEDKEAFAHDATTGEAGHEDAKVEEEEEEEDNTMSYQEYLAQKKSANLTKAEARAPEEIKMTNIEKHNDGKKLDAGKGSSVKSYEAYAPTGIKSSVALGFGAAQAQDDDEEEEHYGGRGRGGRGRGGRGRGGFNNRGDNRGRGRGNRGRGKKFVASDSDFPSL